MYRAKIWAPLDSAVEGHIWALMCFHQCKVGSQEYPVLIFPHPIIANSMSLNFILLTAGLQWIGSLLFFKRFLAGFSCKIIDYEDVESTEAIQWDLKNIK